MNVTEDSITKMTNIQEYSKFFQALISQTDILCDIVSLVSPRNPFVLSALMNEVRETLDMKVPVLNKEEVNGDYLMAGFEFPVFKLQLEQNLAFAYGVLIQHCDETDLTEEKDELFRRAQKRAKILGTKKYISKQLYYEGTIMFHRGVTQAQIEDKVAHSSLEEAIALLCQAHDKARGYNSLYDWLSLINIGRTYFALGEKEKASACFNETVNLGMSTKNYLSLLMGKSHLKQLNRSSFGATVDDTPEFLQRYVLPVIDSMSRKETRWNIVMAIGHKILLPLIKETLR